MIYKEALLPTLKQSIIIFHFTHSCVIFLSPLWHSSDKVNIVESSAWATSEGIFLVILQSEIAW